MPSSEPNFDAKMVDWLYDELDPAAAASFEKHLEDNPDAQAEANALMRTREAFRELEQSEPSAGLSSILMHEASQAAVKSPSLWARLSDFFQPVFMHPAASAMATLVVVAGVAGALYSRNGDMATEPRAAAELSSAVRTDSPAASPEQYGAPIETLAAKQLDKDYADDQVAADQVAADPAAEGGEALAENEGYRVGLADEFAQGAIEEAEDNNRARVEEDKREYASATFADKGRGQGRGKGSFASPPPAKEAKPSVAGDDSNLALAGRASKKKARKNSKAPSNAPPGRSADVKSAEKSQQPKRPVLSWEAQKNNVLKAAAKDKRCRDAGRIANDILDKKPTYYKKKVKGSKAVSDCGRFVAIETQRRAKQRKKQAARSRKKAAGIPKKAKAAPRFDEASMETE